MVQESIVGIERNAFGDVMNIRTSGGRVISYRKALQETELGTLLDGTGIMTFSNHSSESNPH